MAKPVLTPTSTTGSTILPATGTHANCTLANLPFGVYAIDGPLYDQNFISGASDQVAHTFRKLGGDVLDIEITEQNVYAAYEEATLEYSYIVNTHQAKNVLSTLLGDTTGTFNHYGELSSSAAGHSNALSSSLGTDGDRQIVSLSYPKYRFGFTNRVANSVASETGIGGSTDIYSASFTLDTSSAKQDYDLQDVIYSASIDSANIAYPFYNKVGKKKLTIKKVFYKTPHAMWRFYGYYGGLNTVGNLHTYGQYSDDASFEIVPAWQNKLQAMNFEDSIYTRISHFSYEIKNNKIRIFPSSTNSHPKKMWVEFTVDTDGWDEDEDKKVGTKGINNLNTLPFANIPFRNINAIGKQWIRRFALALTKEMLGQVRGKFATIPIPGESVTLNADALISQAKDEQEKLREELKTVLDELTYAKLAETDAGISDNVNKVQASVPVPIFVG